MIKKFFIAGTDTGIGKTYITRGLLHALQARGHSTVALKPVASGCYRKQGQLLNEDAVQLMRAASCSLPYAQVNPFAFAESIAPSIAAQWSNSALNVEEILLRCYPALQQPADYCLIEGVGGWHVPLNARETMADFVHALQMPVILVVGMRLGCLNHALLTAKAIAQSGITLRGWIANCLQEDFVALQENVQTLVEWLPAPLLGVVPYGGEVGRHVGEI